MKTTLIHTSPRRLMYRTIRNVCIGLLGFLSIRLRYPNAKISLEEQFGPNIWIILIYTFVCLLVLILIFHILTRQKKIIGTLTLTEEKIVIEMGSERNEFTINQISDFKVEVSKKYLRKEIASFSGSYENWIIFNTKNESYKYQFILDSYYSGNSLKDLIDIWVNSTSISLQETEN